MTNYEIIPAGEDSASRSTEIAPVSTATQDIPRRGGVSTVTVIVIAAAVCIALLAFVNLAYAGETEVLNGVDTLGRVA